ncbi:MAG: hypothetical protein ACD_65C00292G0004 [uncultured bacterium]|nr:MAG: hypothetical protein ACD_65C00292G0004 [uncultured bacterium]KKT02921.1 MAG: hypothetical protein UV80_C0001G0023 [Candidatus Peregrinibacteria bacterium GW2011_GWF2_43_17]KKT20379.1 MAG: hypothetical protein UW03_C0005G0014 [Candidatus Peregrinibacteria bacterium GW2011_GWA2_43_8]HAU40266.1 hypothetical protein [Candidatus Peregrinibacteria bacterium]
MKNKIAILLASSILFITGCNAENNLANFFGTITKEATEGYENVKSEVETKTNAIEEKYNEINQAAEDLGDAADAIGTAIDSIQQINESPKITETTEESAIQ